MDCNLKKNFNKDECKRRVGEAEFRMIVPKRDNSKNPIKKEILLKYIGKINKIFGGSTTYPSVYGCYPKEDESFFCETNFVITAARDFESIYNKEDLSKLNANQRLMRLKEDYRKLQSLGRKASKELGQDTIFVESDYINDASLVKRKKSKKEFLSKNKIGEKIIDFEEFI